VHFKMSNTTYVKVKRHFVTELLRRNSWKSRIYQQD
jgi:hypothetical protein